MLISLSRSKRNTGSEHLPSLLRDLLSTGKHHSLSDGRWMLRMIFVLRTTNILGRKSDNICCAWASCSSLYFFLRKVMVCQVFDNLSLCVPTRNTGASGASKEMLLSQWLMLRRVCGASERSCSVKVENLVQDTFTHGYNNRQAHMKATCQMDTY